MHCIVAALTVCLLAVPAAGGELPKPTFYLPLDGSTAAAIAAGSPYPRSAVHNETILTLVASRRGKFPPGKVGRCYDVGGSPLVFSCKGNFRGDEGTCSLWVGPRFRGDDRSVYCTFFGAARWGMLYKYSKHTSLTFGTAKAAGDLYYDCSAGDISSWRPGQWHHVVVTWSRRDSARRIYVDGKLRARAPFPFHRSAKDGLLFIGAGCELYPGHVAHAALDEVAVWDQPLDAKAVQHLYGLGKQGRPLWSAKAPRPAPAETGRLDVVTPSTPKPPADAPRPASDLTPTRRIVPLDGWWAFLPADRPLIELPRDGWGLTRVPGYWTSDKDTLGPDGRPTTGTWRGASPRRSGFALGAGRSFAELTVAYHLRRFSARPAWRGRAVFLHLDGVDGLADVFLNGKRLGRLGAWEAEDYDVASAIRYGRQNDLAIVLRTRGGSRVAGLYGNVRLRILPAAFVQDVVVRPSVEKGRIGFSCDVRNGGDPADARIELEVADDAPPHTPARRFVHQFRLTKARRDRPELSAQAQRVECAFDWKDAHLWTYDDPFCYRARARLYVSDKLVDESPVVRFGFREFTMRGADLLLNGKPTHLRGHQIDLGWSDQMKRVRQLKAAGMNCFELSGPIRCNWYAGRPYQQRLFEQMLDYADRHGLIAVPILPSARVLRDRIFEPEVAELYRRRVEKHIRRYGNHPSICLWYMNFNLAGYRWYHPPTKIDGSYKPADAAFRAKERYSLGAQRIARTLDPRPIYHHACGNFGDIFTLNCYIGPTCPLQEREEWPARWAEKRPFPLIACEHGLLLVPYWFRPRQFPLSVVYADEPIFDELTAKYLGRRAYRMIRPEIFDLYDVDRKPRPSRVGSLVRRHPGYQEVKGLFARHSLRAWRTYGVSGILFNAINWDFESADGRPLPVMRALARYFGDTDLYVAGPEGDWPAKDHSFHSGEGIRKQVVLLNDLTRDVPCELAWRLIDASDKAHASGKVRCVARAGRATKIPIELRAPEARARGRFRLAVEPVSEEARRHFQAETFALEVFARPGRPTIGGKLLVFDAVGETTKMLARAGVPFEPLSARSDLAAASCLIVGKKSYGPAFLALAGPTKLDVERAVADGLNLLVFEQTCPDVLGLKLGEQSARRVFVAQGGHPFLKELAAGDFVNLRGRSGLIEAYPEAPPETQHKWPRRYFKWSNRGVVATFVYTKPHYAPFTPVLECGFDLVDSPLLAGRIGRGRIVLCQVDVTSRCGTDPVSTRLVHNLLAELTRKPTRSALSCACLGDSAARFVRRFGIVPGPLDRLKSVFIVAGSEPVGRDQAEAVAAAVRRGATVLLLPGSSLGAAFGLRLKEERFFLGRVKRHPLLAGLSDGDLYLKRRTTMQAARPGGGWEVIAEPGLVAVKTVGKGRVVACQLAPDALGQTRGRIKALRFWNILLANLGARRAGFQRFLAPAVKRYEPNPWEQIPPYINW